MDLFFKIPRVVLPVILVALCAILLAQKIDLTTADLGRHIKNGEILIHPHLASRPLQGEEGEKTSWKVRWQLLHTNFYSYTEPTQAFTNHHWLSGLVFYLIYQLAGFKGLSVLYIFLVLTAFFLFFRLAQKQSTTSVSVILAILVLPIIASRSEVRPEAFTYILFAVFFWVLWHWRQGLLSFKWLFFLPILMLFWVNLHIGFIFGFLALGLFLLEELIKDLKLKLNNKAYRVLYYKSRLLFIIFLLCLVAGLFNPFFIKGLLYPLNIFRNYGYLVVENQSVVFLQRLGLGNGLFFGLFKFLLVLTAISFIALAIKQRNVKIFPFAEFIFTAAVGVLAFLAIRNFPIFGFIFLFVVSGNIATVLPKTKHPAYGFLPAILAFVVLFFGLFRFWSDYTDKKAGFGLGLIPNVNASAEFVKTQNISGPIFNDYDIGGYLIYHLYDYKEGHPLGEDDPLVGWRVFVDNRPEAYSTEFLQGEYVRMQDDEIFWKAQDEKYNFNMIIFSHRDYTPWAQKFLIARVQDPAWAPVFVDSYNIIFVKKSLENVELIRKYLIPKERFGIINQ
ncbi:MAG: hypothetical protein AAB410_03855 [Patescibacteria group bacterium]